MVPVLLRGWSLIAVAAIAVACAAPAPASPTAAPTSATTPPATSAAPPTTPTATPSPTASTPPTAPPTVFNSPKYGYSISLPADWATVAAAGVWDGTGAPGHETFIVDQLVAPKPENGCQPPAPCGVFGWAYAAPFDGSLEDLAAQQTAADAELHPCPPATETSDPVQIDDVAGLFLTKHCPSDSDTMVMSAIVIKDGTGYVFYMQDPIGGLPAETADKNLFAGLLTTVTLP